jgi:site-specific DNA-cytosine methylase
MVISLFSGAMGLYLGLERAGFSVAVVVERKRSWSEQSAKGLDLQVSSTHQKRSFLR